MAAHLPSFCFVAKIGIRLDSLVTAENPLASIMISLEHRLQPALGYLELGMFEEANDELEELPPELRADDEVLGLRIEIFQKLAKWEFARVLAESLAKRSPENPGWWLSWSYALRREQSVVAAQVVLRRASEIHPDVALIAYNLACYACVLGDLAEARTLLKIAFGMDRTLKRIALDDSDLEPLWAVLGKSPNNFTL